MSKPHDGMPRAYLRIDPNLDLTHPDPGASFGSYARQLASRTGPVPGPRPPRARPRQAQDQGIPRRCDVVPLPDGRYYVEGWDEWQEGDWTVAERMRRMRHRRETKRNVRVTPPPSHERHTDTVAPTLSVTTDAGSTDSLSVVPLGDGDGDEIPPPHKWGPKEGPDEPPGERHCPSGSP